MQMLTKKGLPDRRRREFATPELTEKRVACAKAAGRTKLARKYAIKRLQSAAPDLLAALEQCLSLMLSAHHSAIESPETAFRTLHRAEDVARAAITKATGE